MRKPNAEQHNPDPTYARNLIEQSGLTIRAAAQRTGTSERSMRHWLAGNGRLPYTLQYALEQLAR